jgi:DNA-binding transcriptional ArsR family regulator
VKKTTQASIQYNKEAVEQVKEEMIPTEYVGKMASFFKSMSDENRVRIIHALSGQELCVNDLAVALDISQSLVSHQLKLLRLEGLVKPRREGKNIYYSLDDQHVVDMFHLAYTHVRHKVDEHHNE